jgi:hypothetical protein
MLKQATTSPSQEEYSARWQDEYEDSQADRAAQVKEFGLSPVKKFPPNKELTPFSGAAKPLEPGQIRLLDPMLTPDSVVPVFIAIVQPWANGWFLFTPFSQFGFPATAGEFITDQKLPLREVLCSWNSRTAPSSLLERSWVDGSLSDGELMAAHMLRDFLETGFWGMTQSEDLPNKLLCRIGAPIVDPADPRIGYQQEQTRVLGYILSRAMAELEEEAE